GATAEMEEADFHDVLDDWFLESLKTYKDLHVYQLEHPTQVLEWTSAKTVCVAGHASSKNEILELLLPLKLFADENKGLCAERDFKVVHGGFTEGPVRCLTHVPGSRCVVTNDGLSSDLQVWSVGGDDSDVIRLTGRVEGRKRRKTTKSVSGGGSRIAARVSSQVLHGAHSGDVQLTQLTSGQILYALETTSNDPLSSLQFLSDAVFLAGAASGNVYVADTRTAAAPQLHPAPPPASPGAAALWWTAASPRGVLRLSSSGQAEVSDLRSPGAAVSRAQLNVQSGRSDPAVGVSWAPALDGRVAVSGFDGGVQIYDTALWTAAPRDVEPLFEHRGHAVSSPPGVFVAAHAWHPERPRTLLSAASDGSVHVWDWVDQSAAGC
ncbi:WD repeat-containing protein 73, partial [Pseudoliparis swirei]|uniref:WD repeat-containing protein 73 n=1 Tax=Pseudoliparis swirei TaxID=2059687 RepID=UPI0024BE277B